MRVDKENLPKFYSFDRAMKHCTYFFSSRRTNGHPLPDDVHKPNSEVLIKL